MSIQTAIYQALAGDLELQNLLATSKIDTTQPAIYEDWADEETDTPYMNLTYSSTESNHWAKRETILNVDIFSEQDSINAETIKNRVIKILDRQKIELESNTFARPHSNSDAHITESTPDITHWNIEFSIYYWRKNWITNS